MQSEYTAQTDQQVKIKVESAILYCNWLSSVAHAENYAKFEVGTQMVGEGSDIEVVLRTAKGKKLDKVKDKIFRNMLQGEFFVPDSIKPDDEVYFEVKISKLGLNDESYTIPCKPAIHCTRMKWDRSEVRRGEIVQMQAEFEGVSGDEDVMVIVYEYDQDGNHDPIAKIPTVIQQNRIQLQWEYEYHEDTDEIPTQEELQRYGRSYNPPEYFFVVVLDGVRIGTGQESGLIKFDDDILLEFVDDSGNKLDNLDLKLKDPTGKETSHKTDNNGSLSVSKSLPGVYEIIFPCELNRIVRRIDIPPSGKLTKANSGEKITIIAESFPFSC